METLGLILLVGVIAGLAYTSGYRSGNHRGVQQGVLLGMNIGAVGMAEAAVETLVADQDDRAEAMSELVNLYTGRLRES